MTALKVKAREAAKFSQSGVRQIEKERRGLATSPA